MKKIVAYHDLASFGRCSMTTILSVLSSMGMQCCPVPTALLSTHGAINGFTFCDLTDQIEKISNHFNDIKIDFDCIYTGFLGSSQQIEKIENSIIKLKRKNSLIVVDPVMGDNGKIYKTYTPSMCEEMKKLVKLSDVITPNITEVLVLLDKPLTQMPILKQEVTELANELVNRFGNKQIVITGLNITKSMVTTAVFAGDEVEFIENSAIDAYFPGTGDLFTSVLIGNILRGESLYDSAFRASKFVEKAILHTANVGTPNVFGVEYEPFLHEL